MAVRVQQNGKVISCRYSSKLDRDALRVNLLKDRIVTASAKFSISVVSRSVVCSSSEK